MSEIKAVSQKALLLSTASNLTTKIVLSLLVIVLAVLIIKTGIFALHLFSEKAARYRFLKKLGPVFKVFVWMGCAYVVVLFIFQPERETFFAFLTTSGVAIGFASQDILKNIFGGLMIVLDRPFQVGDKIRVGEHYGEVTEIGLRATRILTPDDNTVAIPNSEVVSKSVSNANSGALECQVVTEITVPSHIDLEEARVIAWEAAVTSQYVFLKKPVSVVMADAPSERTVRTKLRIKAYVVDTRLEFAFSTDVLESVKQEFKKRGWIMDDVIQKVELKAA